MAVPTDVTSEAAVQHLAQQAISAFGRIDVWINNAGVLAAGRFQDIPSEVFNRVIETNFLGYVYGARAALQQFLVQGYGILIHNASLESQMGAPYFSPYTASKFAVRGFSDSLREEVEALDQSDIHNVYGHAGHDRYTPLPTRRQLYWSCDQSLTPRVCCADGRQDLCQPDRTSTARSVCRFFGPRADCSAYGRPRAWQSTRSQGKWTRHTFHKNRMLHRPAAISLNLQSMEPLLQVSLPDTF